jgi:hypothetical protein
LLANDCEVGCTDALVAANETSAQWQRLLQSSCRQVFGHDGCQAQSHYNCD